MTGKDGVGQGEWVGPIDAANARESGSEHGGTSYQRPEDLEIIGDTLFVAITEGPRDAMTETDPAATNFGQLEFKSELYEGRVIAINLDTHTLYVNVQHSAAEDGDGTWAIRKTGPKHHDHDD